MPRGVLAVESILARHVVTVDLSAEVQHIPGDGAESDVVSVDFALNRAGLIGTFEVSRDPIAVLRDLDVLHDRLTVLDAGGVNRPAGLRFRELSFTSAVPGPRQFASAGS